MGPPGAGKGTQAKLLAEKIGYIQFSTGDAFRAVSREDSDLGRRVKETIDNGFLAPPEMAAEIVMKAVQEHIAAGEGLIFDGTPRTVKEASIVDDFFVEQAYGRPFIIFLVLDKDEMIRRNSQRKYCLGIDGDFPVVTDEDRDRCAELGGTIGTRPDDEPEKFETRWNEFMTQTFPVIEQYQAEGIVHEIDGLQSIEDTHKQIMELIERAGNE